MRSKNTTGFAVRCSEEELNAYNKFWRERNLGSLSALIRQATNCFIADSGTKYRLFKMDEKIWIDTTIQLHRLNAIVMELTTRAANDNWKLDDEFQTKLKGALNDIKLIRKKVY